MILLVVYITFLPITTNSGIRVDKGLMTELVVVFFGHFGLHSLYSGPFRFILVCTFHIIVIMVKEDKGE